MKITVALRKAWWSNLKRVFVVLEEKNLATRISRLSLVVITESPHLMRNTRDADG